MDTRESRERASRGTSGSSSRHTESQARASDNSEYQRNSGSSAIVDRQKATLVKALTLPTNIKHAYPKDAEWKRIITYLRDAQSQESDIQQEKWNDETRYSIEQVWEETAPENYRDQFRNLTHRWYEIDLKELIMWMDAQTRDEASNFDRESIIAHMNQEILNNPLKIDMSKRTERHNDNNILRAVGVLSLEFDRLEYLHHVQVTENEERAMCHAAFKLIDIKGLTPTTLNETMLSIKASTKRSGFQTLLKDVKREVSHYLGQRQHFKQTFEMSSSSTKNFSESKADSRKSSSDNGSTSSGTKRRNRESADTSTRERKKAKSRSSMCKGCGYNFTKDPETGNPKCPRRDASGQPTGCYKDPRRSHEKTAWKDSSVGMKWKAYGYDYLPKDTNVTLDNAKDKKQSFSNKKGIALVNTLRADKILQPELIPFVLSQETTSANKRKGAAASPPEGSLLLDSGALGSNVMSDSYAKRIRKHSDCYSSIPAKHTIVTAANNKLTSNKIMKVNINLVDERSDTANKPVDVSAVVAPIAVDLILDRQTIRDNNLVQRFPSHFAKGELLDAMEKLPQCELPSQRAGHLPRGSDPLVSYSTPIESTTSTNLNSINVNPVMDSWIQSIRRESYKVKQPFLQEQSTAIRNSKEALTNASDIPTFLANYLCRPEKGQRKHQAKAKQKRSIALHSNRNNMKLINRCFLAYLNKEQAPTSNLADGNAYEREGKLALDEIPSHKLESIPTELIRSEDSPEEHKNVHIDGPPELLSQIRGLVEEFKEIFRGSVQPIPSSAFKPFELQVDKEMWEQPSNAGPARTTGILREREMDKMLNILLDKGLIEDCTDAYYSHPFLTPKSNGSWRLVLDFKPLNRATTSKYEWPIPNIKEMLNRVGESRPELFAVFDLTSGYYQAPIAEESRKYTAFKTRKGVYRWKRLPMGLTDAGSYFQHQLSTKVLNGLIHHICELYLDDCMVFASNAAEYLKRLRQVFLRFREHGISLNPSKCYLGLTQVEYVGHTVNKNGLHFTRDKLDSVMNFPRPETMKHVKSFLGLANYFRDHIRNHSLRVQPLQDLVAGYTKQQARSKINWTPECNSAFADIRQAIDECPLLWFINDHSPVYLKTDASDYGIGAYLYQVVTGDDSKAVEHPIGFISKSLVSGYDKWDIPMKEGFAIFYALKKWEHLLRDRQFTIMTDHLNLTRLRTERSANKMVSRWFLAYQEYHVKEWIHVPGVDNEVADSFSRLCANESSEDTSTAQESPTTTLFQLTGYEMDDKHWDIIRTKGHGTESGRGHGGVKRTIDVLREQEYDWPSLNKDVKKFIKMCPCCQKMNVIKPVIHSYPYTLSSYGLFHTVSVDLIERLTPDEFEMSMIVVIIDNFSRFVDLYPIGNTSAEAAADALLQFCGRYKTPVRFTTDSGSNFKSSLVAGLLERLGADHLLAQAYSKEQNALVERANREVISHLKAIIFDKRVQTKWSKYVPIVQRYLNTRVHSSTGCTPAEIVFPSGAEIDNSLLVSGKGVVASTYIKDMHEAQGRIIAIAESKLREKDEKHMQSREGTEPSFEPGTYVLVEHRHNSLRRGPKSKLLPFLKGPMLVERKCATPGMYTLRDLITTRSVDFHVSKLHTFRYDERTLLPIQVATTDSFDEFVVEKVIDMRGDPRGKKDNISFRLRWAGYTEADDTWEKWKDCFKSDAVQRFLYHHPKKRVNKLCLPGFNPNEVVQDEDKVDTSDDEST
jgi:hypothetical protein